MGLSCYFLPGTSRPTTQRTHQSISPIAMKTKFTLGNSSRFWGVLLAASAAAVLVGTHAQAKRPTVRKNKQLSFQQLDTNKDGILTLTEFESGKQSVARSEAQFIHLDKNKDGVLTEAEFARVPKQVESRFAQLDTNHDGKLSAEEFKAGRSVATSSAAQFRRLDANGDGALSLQEFSATVRKKRR